MTTHAKPWPIPSERAKQAADVLATRLATHRPGDLRQLLAYLRNGMSPGRAARDQAVRKLRGLHGNDRELSLTVRVLAAEILEALGESIDA